MFEKLKTSIRQDRFSKRNKDFDFTEEDGYIPPDIDAYSDSDVFESDKLRIHLNSVLRSLRKMCNEPLSDAHSSSTCMGPEDNRLKALANEKAYKTIIILVCCSASLFFSLSSGINREDKAVYAIRRGDISEVYNLSAQFSFEQESLTTDVELTVNPENYEANANSKNNSSGDSWLSDFAETTINNLEKDNKGDTLTLPLSIDGVSINWVLPKEDAPTWIFALCLLICTYVYFTRYDGIKNDRKRYREELVYEIPNMSRQIILLLNAGLVADAAFSKLYDQTKDSTSPIYIELKQLYEKSVADNSSFASNLYTFALNFGNRELIRFATLIYEHKGRGSELAGKLEAESNLQYENKLAFAKAKAKEAETKLCFPLILLLIALVIICIAPAMFDV